MKSHKLKPEFYLRKNVLQITEELIGKFLVTNFDGVKTSGMIVEAEAYNGAIDKASHAYNGRRTKRNEIMYGEGGVAYVYLCYGIHHLFNVVTNYKDSPHAILIRAIVPIDGIDKILYRRKQKLNKKISDGPGTLSTALGIKTEHSGLSLFGNKIWIEDRGVKFNKKDIVTSPRIGVDYAGEDAKLPYRFRLKEELIAEYFKK
ncbi:MAG TPA: DNA-3-methyladenine glycosylase [Bacteroidia bacterium]|nr:DNA-3-methyladenine glycosylase [Bacteroidia bacterium]